MEEDPVIIDESGPEMVPSGTSGLPPLPSMSSGTADLPIIRGPKRRTPSAAASVAPEELGQQQESVSMAAHDVMDTLSTRVSSIEDLTKRVDRFLHNMEPQVAVQSTWGGWLQAGCQLVPVDRWAEFMNESYELMRRYVPNFQPPPTLRRQMSAPSIPVSSTAQTGYQQQPTGTSATFQPSQDSSTTLSGFNYGGQFQPPPSQFMPSSSTPAQMSSGNTGQAFSPNISIPTPPSLGLGEGSGQGPADTSFTSSFLNLLQSDNNNPPAGGGGSGGVGGAGI